MKRIALVGFGLLAGSIAAAVKQAGLPTVIRAVSSSAGINLSAHLGGFAVGLLLAFLLKLTLPRDRILVEEYEEFEE